MPVDTEPSVDTCVPYAPMTGVGLKGSPFASRNSMMEVSHTVPAVLPLDQLRSVMSLASTRRLRKSIRIVCVTRWPPLFAETPPPERKLG